jgi:predicted ATPase/DNA-binding SARP family transcriptional activator
VVVCRVLGELEVHTGSGLVDLGGPLPRRLVCMLLLAEGQVVSDERLCQAIWGQRTVPSKAVASLQAYVSRVRRVLGDRGGWQVQRVGAGYRLRVAGGVTDVDQFVAGVREGVRRLAAGRPAEALPVLGEALALWRGMPFADLPDDPQVTAARARLAEFREVAVEERLAAHLDAGDVATAVAELEPAVRAAPFRERRWALLVAALYRCGRQREALAALRRVRRLLADELGIDPGPDLQQLERRVLAQDPHLLVSAAGAATPATPTRTTPTPRPESPTLTRPLSTLVGRTAELHLVSALLAEHRLVTLLGPAGVGKTRLAVEYAADRHDPDGPWLVRLADVAMGNVPLAVANAVGLADVAGDRLQALIIALSARPGLLLLDNCEHLTAPVAHLARGLLAGCPSLRILATSRQPLDVDGEQTVPVAPLATRLPDGGDGPAVELLHDRIRTIRPAWAPSDAEQATVRVLCTTLDGLPLALELAAARARVFGLQELADRLHDRFTVLGPVPPGSLQPHATLAAAVAWSVDLLAVPDRAMLLRLWPFEAGFPIDAADAVRPRAVTAALESLSALVTRSVVVADTSATPCRYRLLETIRAYCRDHDETPDVTREAHARWVRDLVAWAAPEMGRGEHAGHVSRVLHRELSNIRAGVAHDLVRQPAAALRTVSLLSWFWIRRGHLREGQELITAALRAAPDAPDVDRARGWAANAALAYYAGDLERADSALTKGRTVLGRPVDEQSTILHGQLLFYAGLIRPVVGDPAAGLRDARQAVEVGRRIGQPWIVVTAELAIGIALTALGRIDEGEQTLARATVLADDAHQYWTAGMTELYLARSLLQRAWRTRQPQPAEHALTLLRHAQQRFQREEDLCTALSVLHTATLALALTGRPHQAARLRIAVQQHATRYGIRPDSTDPYRTTSDAVLTDLFKDHKQPADPHTTDPQTETVSWTETLSLLTAETGTRSHHPVPHAGTVDLSALALFRW